MGVSQSEYCNSVKTGAVIDWNKKQPRGLAQWPEPACQRTFTAAPVHPYPATTLGSYIGEHADPSGFRQKAE